MRVTDNSDQTCAVCSRVIPGFYIDYYVSKEALPVFIQVFGKTAHGKTMWLNSLRLSLMRMSTLWSGFFYQSLTQLDQDTEKALETDRVRGLAPGSTQRRTRDQNEVFIMLLKHIPLWKSRMLVIMDHPGEYFETFKIPVKEIPYLKEASITTIMMISLFDLLNEGQRVNNLLNNYVQAMRNEIKIDLKKPPQRHLVIALTKADKIAGLPPTLKNYLEDDDVWQMANGDKEIVAPLDDQYMEEYVERMERVSKEIARWISSDPKNMPGGADMLGMIKEFKLDVRFTLMSATGRDLDPDGSSSGFNIAPRRVLDTFLWALEFQSQKQR